MDEMLTNAIKSRRNAVGQEAKPPDVPAETPLPTDKKECEHSADYATVTWYGHEYRFTTNQGNCVAALWQEWEKGKGLGLHEKTIGESSGNARPRCTKLGE
jgi:hypothetical protein